MNRFTPYRGDDYHDYDWIKAWCQDAAAAFPRLLKLEPYGRSREGRDLLVLTLHLGAHPRSHPAVWIDGGTHASEWAGVMGTIFTLSRWLSRLEQGDADLTAFFTRHTAYILPCLSPDGFQHMFEGGAYLRSTTRPPRDGSLRLGLEPRDMDGDREVLWMRWKHPSGPWTVDDDLPMILRPRRIDDLPDRAYFACPEGIFLAPDESGWVMAPAMHGLDLNRNFPVSWAPFSQFGMDGGEFSLSEPESRAAVEALAARPNVCAALTMHTYTGAILTSPYRADTAVPSWDLETLHRIATEAVEGTGYRVFKVYPEFQYDVTKTTPGVWADYLVTNRGIVAYTLELWDPYGYAGVSVTDPAKSFVRPDLEAIRATVSRLTQLPDTWRPWRPFQHPQLGAVEIGGLREQHTIRNPPVSLLPVELDRAFTVADRLRRTLPEPTLELKVAEPDGAQDGRVRVLTARVENRGYLGTWALTHAEKAGFSGPPLIELELEGELKLVQGQRLSTVPHLSGWGDAPSTFRRHPLNPVLSLVSPRHRLEWTLTGTGTARVIYSHPRTGRIEASIEL